MHVFLVVESSVMLRCFKNPLSGICLTRPEFMNILQGQRPGLYRILLSYLWTCDCESIYYKRKKINKKTSPERFRNHARHFGDFGDNVQENNQGQLFISNTNTLSGVKQNFKSNFLSFKYFFGSQNLHNWICILNLKSQP